MFLSNQLFCYKQYVLFFSFSKTTFSLRSKKSLLQRKGSKHWHNDKFYLLKKVGSMGNEWLIWPNNHCIHISEFSESESDYLKILTTDIQSFIRKAWLKLVQ